MEPLDVMSWAQFVGLLVAPGMTLIVAYVTKASWPAKWKGSLLVALSLVNGILVEAFSPHEDGWDLRTAILRAVLAFVTAQASYTAIVKNTEIKAIATENGVRD